MSVSKKLSPAPSIIMGAFGLAFLAASLLIPDGRGHEALDEAIMAASRGANDQTRFKQATHCGEHYGGGGGVMGSADCLEEYVTCVYGCGYYVRGTVVGDDSGSGQPMTFGGNSRCGGDRVLGVCSYNATTGNYFCDGANAYVAGKCDWTVSVYYDQLMW